MKSKHPGIILMFECGYRFRFFGEDAFVSARVLDISVNDDADARFASSSVPTFNGASTYVKKLVAAGFKVPSKIILVLYRQSVVLFYPAFIY